MDTHHLRERRSHHHHHHRRQGAQAPRPRAETTHPSVPHEVSSTSKPDTSQIESVSTPSAPVTKPSDQSSAEPSHAETSSAASSAASNEASGATSSAPASSASEQPSSSATPAPGSGTSSGPGSGSGSGLDGLSNFIPWLGGGSSSSSAAPVTSTQVSNTGPLPTGLHLPTPSSQSSVVSSLSSSDTSGASSAAPAISSPSLATFSPPSIPTVTAETSDGAGSHASGDASASSNSDHMALGAGPIAGIAAGGAVALIAIIALLAYLLRRAKHKRDAASPFDNPFDKDLLRRQSARLPDAFLDDSDMPAKQLQQDLQDPHAAGQLDQYAMPLQGTGPDGTYPRYPGGVYGAGTEPHDINPSELNLLDPYAHLDRARGLDSIVNASQDYLAPEYGVVDGYTYAPPPPLGSGAAGGNLASPSSLAPWGSPADLARTFSERSKASECNWDGPMTNPFDRYDDGPQQQSYEYDYSFQSPHPTSASIAPAPQDRDHAYAH